MRSDMSVKFWGVRGSIPCPGPETARYGGNTACVEVRCGDRLIIFDGGSGLRLLGKTLAQAGTPVDADIFYTHFHSDHVCGLPFFAPCYVPSTRLRLWAGTMDQKFDLREVLRRVTDEPLSPIGLESFKANVEFREFRTGDVLRPHAAITLRTGPLHHPGGATGYRLEYGDAVLAYVTDTEHTPGVLDPNVLALAADADLMIYDGAYTDDGFPAKVGLGHSTWQQGIRLANAARAKTLAIFHHDPDHTDGFLDRISGEAERARPGTIVSAEGMTLSLGTREPIVAARRQRG